MKLRLARELPCSPEIAFAAISEPSRINLWSAAPVRSLARGDGGHPGGVGALREVRVGRRRLEEVVEVSRAPERLVYRMVSGVPARRHRGEQRITGTRDGCRLEWDVDVELPVPGSELVARRRAVPDLERSLDRLVEVVRRMDDAPSLPPPRDLSDARAEESLYRDADAVLEEQRRLADELARARDPKAWFTRAFEYVSELQLEACRAGRFQHPGWVLRLIPRFHHHFLVNLERALHRRDGEMEAHWREAFDAIAHPMRHRRGHLRAMGYGVFRGMRAHTEEDLPRALAEVYLEHYADRCDYARFRADHLRMAFVYGDAAQRMIDQLRREVPLRVRVLHRVVPSDARDAMMHRDFYDTTRKRRGVFERGGRLVAMMREATEGSAA